MDNTVFLTVVSGVATFVLGQILLKLFIEPVQEMRKTIGQIAHAMVERSTFIQNPGVQDVERTKEVSRELRALSAKLQSQLYAVPVYESTARLFRLPPKESVLRATKSLIGLSSGLYSTTDTKIYEVNAKSIEKVCDLLGIFVPEDQRWPKELQ